MKKILLLTIGLVLAVCVRAQSENWDYITSGAEYYYGLGTGDTQEEASNAALANMMQNIVVNVQNDFSMLAEETNTNGELDSRTKVMNCMNTYSQGTFTNVRMQVRQGKGKNEPAYTVLRYMLHSELQRVFEGRVEAARNYMRIADGAMERRKVDMALQYYYWAYSLARSLQHPYEAKDDDGKVMVTEIPVRMRDILSRIEVKFDSQEEEYVNLLFYYDGAPASCIDFSYNDGESEIEDCKAQDGRGCLEMMRAYKDKEAFHVSICYEYISQSRGDAEMSSVLAVVPRQAFKEASHVVMRPASDATVAGERTQAASEVSVASADRGNAQAIDRPLAIEQTQQPDDMEPYAEAMRRIVTAIGDNRTSAVSDLFDIDGLDVFSKVMNYGTPHLVGEQNLTFFKGANGTVTARGMQMSFTFNGERQKKASFTEDLVFTFNSEGKICNVAFGLGKVAESDILCRNVDWGDETKELIMEFMENYKTAYCLKRLEYIRNIFADDAVIIVGNVAKRTGGTTNIGEHKVTEFGQDLITYNRYDKDTYLKNLERCFTNPRNSYINVKFANNDVQSLRSFDGHKVFGIQIKQLYNSATYADEGYLFLMIDMTDPDEPLIKIRTWQPDMTPMDELYKAGDFYR